MTWIREIIIIIIGMSKMGKILNILLDYMAHLGIFTTKNSEIIIECFL